MKINCLFKYFLLTVFCLTGCSLLENGQHDSLTERQLELNEPTDSQIDIRDYSLFAPQNNHKKLNDYVQQMVMDYTLDASLDYPIAIASFVELDGTLTKTNRLGNQLAEAFMVEMSQAGYPVADANASGGILVHPDGNFAFTRHQQAQQSNFCCVLSGNLIYQSNGVLINSRVFDIQTKRVYAASSLLIPYFVIEHLGQAQIVQPL